MVTVMDMESGIFFDYEFGPFKDQVLDANWLPCPELAVGLQEALTTPVPTLMAPTLIDVDAFLRNVYLLQE
jgi:hypothetical protein